MSSTLNHKQHKLKARTAFQLEFFGGLFGLLGGGHFYLGRTKDGVLLFYIWIMVLVLSYTIIHYSPRLTALCVCLPLQLLFQLAVPFWIARRLKLEVIADQTINEEIV